MTVLPLIDGNDCYTPRGRLTDVFMIFLCCDTDTGNFVALLLLAALLRYWCVVWVGRFDPHMMCWWYGVVCWLDWDMLHYCTVKYNEIDLYVEHEIDTTIFTADDLLLSAASVEGYGDGNQGGKGGEGVEGLNGEGVKVVGSKYGEVDVIGQGLDSLDASVEGSGDSNQGGEGGEVEVDECGECVEGLNGEGVEVVGNKSFEVARGLNSGVKEADEEGVKDESDNGDDEEELQEARQKLKEVDRKTNGKVKETIVDETENESF
ncbi:hypothetical protein Gotri_006849 [Gossypium trilobum]|uniref:Uncharacterized protein n=1 Tax=Gossypium trilobum TaxID=34281 RepID=A0A7J9FU35_9ROSI|nr:hypothetical protein [Gossypium trilobum]